MKIKIWIHTENTIVYHIEYVWYTSKYFKIKFYQRTEDEVFRRVFEPLPFTLKDFYKVRQK